MQFFRQEMKVGTMIFVGVALLLTMIFLVGKFSFRKPSTYNVYFKEVSGLGVDAPVMFAGYNIGKVNSIKILSPAEAKEKKGANIEVILNLDKPNLVRVDSRVDIRTLGFMGEKYIDIYPGSEHAKILPDGENLYGEHPQDFNLIVERLGKELDYVTPKVNSILDEIESASKKMEDVFTDIEDNKYIPQLFQDIEEAMNDIKIVTKEIREVVDSNRSKVDNIINNIQTASVDVKNGVSNISGRVDNIIQKIEKVIDNGNNVVTNVDGIVLENRKDIHKIIVNLEKTATNMKEFARTINEHPWRLIFKTPEEKREENKQRREIRQRRVSEKQKTKKVQQGISTTGTQGNKLIIGNKFN